MTDTSVIERVREVLVEISQAKGAFSFDPLEHASNTIDDMAGLAQHGISIIDEYMGKS
jgi:hypothetical protein